MEPPRGTTFKRSWEVANVIVSTIAIALIIATVAVLTQAALSSASSVTLSWDRMVRRDADIARAELKLITADIGGSGTNVDISVGNSGQTALRHFADWAVIIQYYATSSNQGLNIKWLPYTTSTPPSSDQWTVSGLYMNASSSVSEVYDPNVFNPGEEMIIRLNITPAIPTSTDNLVTVGAPNGVTVAAPFSR